VNYSSIRAGMLEFRRRCEMVQHGVLVHQLCRPVWAAWMKQAVLAGASKRRASRVAASPPSPVPRGEVDSAGLAVGRSEKEFKAMLLAIRAGLMSRSEAISAFGYDAEDVDREIAADNQRADDLGLIFDSDPRRTSKDGGSADRTRTLHHRRIRQH
jgi:capsid protein